MDFKPMPNLVNKDHLSICKSIQFICMQYFSIALTLHLRRFTYGAAIGGGLDSVHVLTYNIHLFLHLYLLCNEVVFDEVH